MMLHNGAMLHSKCPGSPTKSSPSRNLDLWHYSQSAKRFQPVFPSQLPGQLPVLQSIDDAHWLCSLETWFFQSGQPTGNPSKNQTGNGNWSSTVRLRTTFSVMLQMSQAMSLPVLENRCGSELESAHLPGRLLCLVQNLLQFWEHLCCTAKTS